MGAGDGYNRHFDAVLQDFQRKERCVDDTVFWDEDLEGHWLRVIEFLETMGRSEIILNPEKFQFCAKDVKFTGFSITKSRVAPLAKYIDAIQLFPTPQNITNIRSTRLLATDSFAHTSNHSEDSSAPR